MFAVKTNIPTLFDEFNTLNSLFDTKAANEGRMRPAVDVYDSGESFVVVAELPGVDEKSVDIEFADNLLTVFAERKIIEAEGQTYHRREISGGTFKRSMKFSTPIDSAKISASYKNGLLEITLPKEESTKPRKIQISAV